MECLTFNAVLRIEARSMDGFYRVVAVAAGKETVWLAYVGPRESGSDAPDVAAGATMPINRHALTSLADVSRLAVVDLDDLRALAREESLSDTARRLWADRQAAMRLFLDPLQLSDSLYATGGIGRLVRRALCDSNTSRATVYRLWRQLCVRGFTALALMPVFDQCGARGVLRPVEGGRRKPGVKSPHERACEVDPLPQRGATADDRIKIAAHVARRLKPGMSYLSLYDDVVRDVYVKRYVQTEKGREAVPPEQGTFPNRRQFRRIVETEFKALDRIFKRTTKGHHARNLRGLVGRSYDGVAGPGHAYAIDSTIGDMYLRSAINPAWIIGRPIVYIIVDIWSTDVVGFYVCLRPPSWRAAKAALFSTFADPKLIAELWGYEHRLVLEPVPTAPFTMWCDRGEYLSAGARETSLRLGFNTAINPAYRPDLKGMVEVLHRITKDTQFSEFVPGAINARRRELELRPDAKESALTLREYVQYLHMVFTQYNGHARREGRNFAELIASGLPATPAGLWRFGHEVGLGFRRHIPHDQLVAGLLEPKTLVARRDGNFVESLQYEGDLAIEEQWSAQARNLGVIERQAYCYPGYAGKLWVASTSGLQEFHLRPNARAWPEVTFDEWRDALGVAALRRSEREHQRLCDALRHLDARHGLVENAIERTKAAEALSSGAQLTTREARDLEASSIGTALLARPGSVPEPAAAADPVATPSSDYDAMMDDLLAGVLQEGAA